MYRYQVLKSNDLKGIDEMKIAIYGAGDYGKYIYNEIMKNKNTKLSVVCWIDNFYNEDLLESLHVYSEEDFFSLHISDSVDAVIVAIQKWTIAEKIIVSILLRGYESIYCALPSGYLPQIPVLNEDGELGASIKFYKLIKPAMRRPNIVDFLVTDYCNLKCKRCGNFSNLVTECNYLDINKFEKYLVQLRKRFKEVFQIELMGGEPLLNLKLESYIALTRKYFPETQINIVTNGLLILEMKKSLIDTIVSCHANLYISQYPPTRKRIGRIVDFLEEKGIQYYITSPITQFEKVLTLKEQDGENAYAERHRRNNCICHAIEDGRMGCPQNKKIYDNQKYFGIQVEEEEMQKSSIDLMDDNIDGWDILKFFRRPSVLCKYCNPELEYEPWETGLPQAGDWFSE